MYEPIKSKVIIMKVDQAVPLTPDSPNMIRRILREEGIRASETAILDICRRIQDHYCRGIWQISSNSEEQRTYLTLLPAPNYRHSGAQLEELTNKDRTELLVHCPTARPRHDPIGIVLIFPGSLRLI